MVGTRETAVDILVQACRRHGDGTAFTCMGADLSYRRLDTLSRRFAAYLHIHAGLVPGDRLAIQLPNILQYPVVLLGALRAGLVVVNTNPLYSEGELEHQLNDSGAKALVVLTSTAANAARVVPRTAVKTVIVTQPGDLHGVLKGRIVNLAARYLKKTPAPDFSAALGLSRAFALGRAALGKGALLPGESGTAGPTPDTLALLQYTGGTTGVSKGAMLTHGNLAANMYQIRECLREECPGPGEVMVAPLPLYHIYAFTVHILYGMHRGLHNLLITDARDIRGFVRTVKGYRIAGIVGINTLYNALCASSEFAALDFSGLKISCAGGMPLSRLTFRRWQRLTGCSILEGYGLSEASPVVACNRAGALREGTIGKPVAGTEVKVIDDTGRELPVGEAGELCVRGPQVMRGYWRRPEETRQVLDGAGWLHTGDVAVIQPDGFLRIVDRIKDLIIVSGYNVYPAEIEEHVCKHPGVSEAAAVGIKRGDIGEKVKLFVVARDSGLSRKELIEFCRRGLAPYKVPGLIEFCDSLPKSNVGKVLRRELRDTA